MQCNLTSECWLLGDKKEMQSGEESLLKRGPCIHTYARAVIKICMVSCAVHLGLCVRSCLVYVIPRNVPIFTAIFVSAWIYICFVFHF
uniref:Uncharacterized protein n=1 Tax=Rhipicephalus appendiculatus TaxID=34631 RepID=A0A131YEV1_RHIAP